MPYYENFLYNNMCEDRLDKIKIGAEVLIRTINYSDSTRSPEMILLHNPYKIPRHGL